MQKRILDLIKQQKIYPIIRCNDTKKASDISKSLIDAGVEILEITVENDELFDVINDLSSQIKVCAGGIITVNQANKAIESGCCVISSPILQTNMVKLSKNRRIPLIASVSTANEAYTAWQARVPLTKIYPAKALGGVEYIEDILRPMPFLNLMPMGHIGLEEVQEYINAGASAVGVGRNLYEGLNYSEITTRTKNALEKIKG